MIALLSCCSETEKEKRQCHKAMLVLRRRQSMSLGQYTPDTKMLMLKTTEEMNLIWPQQAFSAFCGKTGTEM